MCLMPQRIAKQQVAAFTAATRAGLEHQLEQQKTMELLVEAQAPLVVLPASYVRRPAYICVIAASAHGSSKSLSRARQTHEL